MYGGHINGRRIPDHGTEIRSLYGRVETEHKGIRKGGQGPLFRLTQNLQMKTQLLYESYQQSNQTQDKYK